MPVAQDRMFTIEQARILAGYTQAEIAERLGMSEKTYIQYEKYRKIMKMDVGFRFCKLTQMQLDQVIFFEGQLQKICS